MDTGVGEGDTIPADFDSMIAKIIAYGRTRDEALARLRRAMAETTVVIEGGATNKSFILDLLDQSEVVDGKAGWADTSWIDRVRAEGRLVVHEHSGIAVVAAGIEAYEDEAQVEITRLLESAHGGRPQVQHKVGRAVDFKLRGTAYKVTVHPDRPAPVPGRRRRRRRRARRGRRRRAARRVPHPADRRRPASTAWSPPPTGPSTWSRSTASPTGSAATRAACSARRRPALVVASPVAVGDLVAAGAPVLVLESMKMETVLRAPFAARVRELLVVTGSQVETGAPLVRLEPVEDDADRGRPRARRGRARTSTCRRPRPASTARQRAARGRDGRRRDADGLRRRPARATATSSPTTSLRATSCVAAGEDVVADEIELLGLFADLAELSRNRPAGEDLHTELRVHSSKEHFHAYLQSLDVDRGGLPEQFRDRLARVLAHYGVTDWDRTPQLEEAVFRIFLAQQRSAPEVHLATELLQRWIAEPPPAEELAGPARDLLERLVRSTQLRFPVVGDLARSTRFRWFDQPLVDAERSSVLAGVRDEVAALAADPDAPDRTERMEALAAIPEQIVRFLAERLETGVPEQEPMLEVLVRRHYREHDLHGLRSLRARGSHVRGGRLHPRRPPDPAGLDRRHHRRARPTRAAR